MILVLSLILACSAQLICPQIYCGTNTAPSCYTYNQTINTGLSSQCGSGYYCPFSYANMAINYACTAEPTATVTNNGVPGQSCNTTNQCVAGVTCTSGYCVGISKNSACTATSQCKPGLYCKTSGSTSTCQDLIEKGKACTDADECTYGTLCHNGVCTTAYSIAPGSSVDYYLCSSYGYSPMCRYGECFDVNATNSICINYMKNTASYDKPCTTCEGTAVTGATTYSRTVSCACGLGGKSYCPGFLGDTYGAKSYELARKYLLSSDAKKCNIHAGLSCMYDHWDNDDYYEYQFYTWMASERWKIIYAEPCLYEYLDQAYTFYKYNYDMVMNESSSDSSSSGAEMLAISAFILSLVA